MKFHCDRCKTRYSIADERVRGKILKIRCKNCSAVITVREEMGEAAEAAPPAIPATAAGGSALRGAFEQVMARPTQNPAPTAGAQPDPSPSQSFRAPDHFEEEWYVSEDGDQVGPFSLPAAKEWVLAKPPGAELYCWQEDFDDWLPVEKVSHFRGLRGRAETPPAPAPRPATVPPPTPGRAPAGGLGRVAAGPVASPDPQPLFTATMNRLEAEQRKRTEEPAPPKASPPANGKTLEAKAPGAPPAARDANASIFPDDDDSEDDLDLDIGEASRIVNLAMIMPPAGRAEAAKPEGAAGAGLPGVAKLAAGRQTQSVARIGRGSGEQGAVGMPPLSDAALADAHPPILTPVAQPKKVPLLLLLLIGGAVVASLVGVLIYVAMSGEDDGDARLARSQLSGEEFARRGDYDPFKPVAADDDDDDVVETAPDGTTTKPSVKRPATTTARDKPAVVSGDGDTGPKLPGDLPEGGVTPLRPQEVITMSSRQGLGTRRCYERALKKDPFLDVKNIKVQLTVAPSGVVTEVKLASQAQSFLGQCLAATIRTWPFRKSTKGITMDVTLSFEQQG